MDIHENTKLHLVILNTPQWRTEITNTYRSMKINFVMQNTNKLDPTQWNHYFRLTL